VYFPQILEPTNKIDVEVSGLSRFFQKSLTLGQYSPEIHFYVHSPVYGPLYHKALKGSDSVSAGAIGIVAEPFFIPSKDLSNTPYAFNWQVNSNPTENEGSNLIFLNTEIGSGFFNLLFEVDHPTEFLRQMSRALRLN